MQYWRHCGSFRASARTVKIYGYVLLPRNFNIGLDARWASGPALNVFSTKQPEEYETGELEVLPWGTPLEYQLPRRCEVGLRLEF